MKKEKHPFLTKKRDIESWLFRHKIKNYTIHNDDMSVSVEDNVDLSHKNLKRFNVQFRHVSGYFNCGNNRLTSLLGAPKTVSLSFSCDSNPDLTSLVGAPAELKHNFSCVNCGLLSLKGAPEKVDGSFRCCGNQLTTLEYGPREVTGEYHCSNNALISLLGAPIKINGSFLCYSNLLTNLRHCPKHVGENFNCTGNHLNALLYCPETLEGWFISGENKALNYLERMEKIDTIHKYRTEEIIKREKMMLLSALDSISPDSTEMKNIFKI